MVPSETISTTVSTTSGVSGLVGTTNSGANLSTNVVNRPHIAPKPALEKRDSFEGHEEAVRTIVEEIKESRIKQQKKDG